MTTAVTDWHDHAHRLADELEQAGKLTTPEWRQAICAVPRHELVPTYHQPTSEGTWREIDTSTDEGLRTVYSNTVLVTALTTGTAGTTVLSSSTQPGLMTRMLEALDVHDEHRVLEVGTGTGYNAALLAHRLGDERVFSIDVEPHLVEIARNRLARVGYHPTLAVGDGAAGLAEHAPFDRVIATCAVPSIPWSWVEQTQPGGVILTDVKPALGAGSLVRLTRHDDRAEGRFDATYAAFMDLRHHPGGNLTPARTERDHSHAEHRTSPLDPRTPWTSMIVWFLASFALGRTISFGYTGADTTQPPTASWISTLDGSWAEISLTGEGGQYTVAEGGPRRLWSLIENAHQRWTDLGTPGWGRFGLTVTPERQLVWLDEPHGESIGELT
ncbi:ATP-grasp peptide maturase system methyltransferase [Saccharopolyspora shandongensis]|uniref:ATP-grasp peptide maturase system methyltransferase n=1 Tax=Saccharopolyspora shandongensis TaxID=418495 RepID=UPI0033CB9D5A